MEISWEPASRLEGRTVLINLSLRAPVKLQGQIQEISRSVTCHPRCPAPSSGKFQGPYNTYLKQISLCTSIDPGPQVRSYLVIIHHWIAPAIAARSFLSVVPACKVRCGDQYMNLGHRVWTNNVQSIKRGGEASPTAQLYSGSSGLPAMGSKRKAGCSTAATPCSSLAQMSACQAGATCPASLDVEASSPDFR